MYSSTCIWHLPTSTPRSEVLLDRWYLVIVPHHANSIVSTLPPLHTYRYSHGTPFCTSDQSPLICSRRYRRAGRVVEHTRNRNCFMYTVTGWFIDLRVILWLGGYLWFNESCMAKCLKRVFSFGNLAVACACKPYLSMKCTLYELERLFLRSE